MSKEFQAWRWIESYVGYLFLLVRAGGMLIGTVQRLIDGTVFNSVVRSWFMNYAMKLTGIDSHEHIHLITLTFALIQNRPTNSVLDAMQWLSRAPGKLVLSAMNRPVLQMALSPGPLPIT